MERKSLLVMSGICFMLALLLVKSCAKASAGEQGELQVYCTAVAQPCMTCWWGVPGPEGPEFLKQSEATPDPEPPGGIP